MKKRQFILDIKGEEEESEDDYAAGSYISRIPPPKSSPWEEIAKFELEELLGCATEYKEYKYYERLGGFHIKSLYGAECENGESEWIVFRHQSAADEAAKARIIDDLEEDPTIFGEDFIARYINEKGAFEGWARGEAESIWRDADAERLFEAGFLEEDKDEYDEEEMAAAFEEAIQSDIDSILDEGAVDYFKNTYGRDNWVREIIEALGLDYESAADDIVSNDGTAHILDMYDGKAVELPSGAVAFGVN